MLEKIMGVCCYLLIAAAVTAAQTTVTTSGGNTGTIPLYTGSATLGNSLITQSAAPYTLNIGPGVNSIIYNTDNGTFNFNSTYSAGPNMITMGDRSAGEFVLDSNTSNTSMVDWELKLGWGTYQFPSDAFYIGRAPGATGSGTLPQSNASLSYFFLINSSGNVGIGTTTPSQKLEVNGNTQVDGTLTGSAGGAVSVGSGGIVFPNGGGTQTTAWTGTVCGGDYAESVDVTGDRTNYGPGDVLVIDPDAPGKFLKSAEPYSTSVLGVYSTKPGVLGRAQTTPKSADEVPMAMVGIVPTKVSAENGAIRPGDLLVTSSTPGYAMKGTDRSRMLGAVIGKALGSLEEGTGVIEVGVTLQ